LRRMRLLNMKTREKPHSTHTMFILLVIEVKAVHGLLSTARTNTVPSKSHASYLRPARDIDGISGISVP
jgi:hypothetical protein